MIRPRTSPLAGVAALVALSVAALALGSSSPSLIALAVLGMVALYGPSGAARQPEGSSGTEFLAINQPQTKTSVRLHVTSPDVKEGAAIPDTHSDYGQKISPELRWSDVPADAASIVVLMEDPDAPKPKPFVHWVLYNLPASMTMLTRGLPAAPRLDESGEALQGRTSAGNIGYFGPRPPKPHPAHRYYFMVFALDTMLPLDPGADRDHVLEEMSGHVLAAGALMGTFKAPTDAK